MKVQRLAGVLLVILGFSIPAAAQYATSTIQGVVRSANGEPLSSARIGWLQQGQMRWLETDTAGKFIGYFVEPGTHTFRLEYPPFSDSGTHVGIVPANSSLVLTIVLKEAPFKDLILRYWDIHEELPGPSDVWKPEAFLTKETMETFPGTGHVWTFLNSLEPSVVSDPYDISGLKSLTPFRIGVRGSSWTQNYASLNGNSMSDPSGNGMLMFPDMSAMEAIVYSVGESPMRHISPGMHLETISKSGGRDLHGEAWMYFQNGSLENSNVTDRLREFDITQPDQRWKHFLNGGFQISGPVGKRPWSYFAAVSGRDLLKEIRTQNLPISGNVLQQTYNLTRSASSNNRAGIYISLQDRNEPQFGASPQIRRDASVDQKQNYRSVQGSWGHDVSPRRTFLARLSVTSSQNSEGFQKDATGQSEQDLFPGFVVDGITPTAYELLNNNRLINTVRGPAPLITNSHTSLVEGSASYSIVHDGFWNSKHRITFGSSLSQSSRSQSQHAPDNVNLLFFEGEPNSVLLLNSPSTRDRFSNLEFYAFENFSISRFSFLAGTSVNTSRSLNVLSSGKYDNANYWRNIGGRMGASAQFIRRIVVRAAYAQIYDEPNMRSVSAVNPEGLESRLYSWNDANGDGLFQPGENTQLLKVTGGPVTRLDPNLKNPKTSELTVGVAQNGLHGFHTEFYGFRRTTHNLMSLVNEGVPSSSFDPVQVVDPGMDSRLGTEDDQVITVFNQKPATLGQDRYLLTNPAGFTSHSEGFEFSIGVNTSKVQASSTVTRYRAVADTGPGLRSSENDTSNLLGIFDNPNNAIFARGSTFFDRGTLLRMWAAVKLPAGIRTSLIGNYQDGLPYARVLPVVLNQGVTGILTGQRGPGNQSTTGGIRTTHYQSIDARFSKNFKLRSGALIATLDIFNMSNLALNTVQMEVTSHEAEWRAPIQVQSPRSFQPGIRYTW